MATPIKRAAASAADKAEHHKRARNHRDDDDYVDNQDSVSKEDDESHGKVKKAQAADVEEDDIDHEWVPSPEWRTGTDRYRGGKGAEVLGKGGFGTVVRVVDMLGGPDRARKRQTYQQVPTRRLLFEVQALKVLQPHRGIVELIDICHKKGKIDIIMPIYWGSLQDLLDQEGRELRHGMAKNLSLQLFGAISHVHRQGFAHLDIKPGNLLLSDDGCIKIGDFGLAAEVGGSVGTHTVGTIGYSAPECLLGSRRATFQADIWSTGCVVAEMFTGRPLFTHSCEEIAMRDILRFTGHAGGPVYTRRDLRSSSNVPAQWPPSTSDSDLRLQDAHASAAQLIVTMLQLEPSHRPHLVTLMQHRLFTEVTLPKKLPCKASPPSRAVAQPA
ncbi:hypothetical protein A4X13_0g5183 [Tilletia indica]|uniref:Uncharacterized protein n=1 Tax=Tilletia indica TaxID=43049 RepID=A0A177TUN5_9BASI|nr:hypothetical protein A4X13_0g5183 [Tilletia indica]